MKNFILATILSLLSVSLCAQVPESTKDAARLYQDKEYAQAKELIDKSVNGDGAENAYTWHVRGHVYKELYKQVDQFDRNSDSRTKSVDSFVNSMSLDDSGEYAEWNRTSLKYLSSTYWNDAVNLIENGDSKQLGDAEKSYELYKETVSKYDSEQNTDKVSVDFYKAYSTANRKLIEKQRGMGVDPAQYETEFTRIQMCYDKAISMAQDDYGSNYNYAINLYNEAAYRIERIPADADLTLLLLEQEGCVELFKKALPFAKVAYDQKPGRIEILKALRAIYLSLNDYESFEKYDLLIKEKQGEINTPSKMDLNNLRKEGMLDH